MRDRPEAELIVRCGLAFILAALSHLTSTSTTAASSGISATVYADVVAQSPREHVRDLQLALHSALHSSVIFYGEILSFKTVTGSLFSLNSGEFPFKCGKESVAASNLLRSEG